MDKISFHFTADVDPEIIEVLRKRAARNDRSLQGEIKNIMRRAAEEFLSQHPLQESLEEALQRIEARNQRFLVEDGAGRDE